MPTTDKRPLKVFLCHAHATVTPCADSPQGPRLTQDGVDCFAWLDKENHHPRAGLGIGNLGSG
jgi:hypothetical protein